MKIVCMDLRNFQKSLQSGIVTFEKQKHKRSDVREGHVNCVWTVLNIFPCLRAPIFIIPYTFALPVIYQSFHFVSASRILETSPQIIPPHSRRLSSAHCQLCSFLPLHSHVSQASC